MLYNRRRINGWQKYVWRFMYRNRLEKLHWDVLEQDRIVLEDIEPDARKQELLYDHDMGLAGVRRELKERAENQLVELAAIDTRQDKDRADMVSEE